MQHRAVELQVIYDRQPKIHESYEHKENRDKRAVELKRLGFTVRKSSLRDQQMHPKYLKDYSGEGLDNGFGNGHYRTFFSVVYIVEANQEVKLFGYE